MKKSLLLLPLAALLLTGCDEFEDEEISTSIPEISNAAVDSLSNMYKAAVNGVSLEFELSEANITYKSKITEVYTSPAYSTTRSVDVDIKNFGFTLKLDARNLDKAIKDWEVAIAVKGLHFVDKIAVNGSILADDESFDDIDFGFYLKNNTLYSNLSDPELKSCANSVIDLIFGIGTEQAIQYKALVNEFAKDLYIEHFADFVVGMFVGEDISKPEIIPAEKVSRAISGLENLSLFPSELPADLIAEMKKEFPSILETILGPTSPLSKAINVTLANNLLNKIEVNFKSTDLPPETFQGDNVSFTVALTANFNETGLLTKIETDESFDVIINDTKEINGEIGGEVNSLTSRFETTHLYGSVAPTLTVTYPTTPISMPDFSSYEPFTLPQS